MSTRAEWVAFREDAMYYMPGMVVYRRKRSGWRKHVENVLLWCMALGYIALAVIASIYTYGNHWDHPVIIAIVSLYLGVRLLNYVINRVNDVDYGLHNLEGYDPVTGTIPKFEAQGIDSKRFHC